MRPQIPFPSSLSGSDLHDLIQQDSSIFGDGLSLSELALDGIPGLIPLHQTALSHCTQLLLLAHLALHHLHLFTSLQQSTLGISLGALNISHLLLSSPHYFNALSSQNFLLQWERKLDEACTLSTGSLHTTPSPTVNNSPFLSVYKVTWESKFPKPTQVHTLMATQLHKNDAARKEEGFDSCPWLLEFSVGWEADTKQQDEEWVSCTCGVLDNKRVHYKLWLEVKEKTSEAQEKHSTDHFPQGAGP